MAQGGSENYTLPKNIRPIHYDLQLEPDFDTCRIQGKARIEVEFLEESIYLTINSIDIIVKDVLLAYGATERSVKTITQDESKQELKMEFDEAVPRMTRAILSLNFEAILGNKGAGFYLSRYEGESGKKNYIACTQMEPVDARRVFPCFDEPALKATFSITLVAQKDLTCLSNMNMLSEEPREDNKKLVKFARTPLMSTYLVAMVIGDLEYIESNSFRIPIRVYSTPGRSADGKFAVELAAKTLQFYEEAFDSPFPLPKIDFVAIHDQLGAMENWGLIIGSSSVILLDEKSTGVDKKQRVASVVQHELAHQWFGNLVTMDFWDGLWLNKGFATWMSRYSSNVFYPEWKVWQQFVIGELQNALGLDCLRNSHPIEVPVENPNDINQIFDAISYSKGACVIRMLAKYIGEDVFLRGVQVYLKKHAYGNSLTSDLWDAMTAVSGGKDIASEMSIWTKKVGYPILTIHEIEAENKIIVRQDRFIRSMDLLPEENETLYPVSLGLITDITTADQHKIVLNSRQMEVQLKDMKFFKLNSKHAGFFRTLYTPKRLLEIGEAMNAGLLSVEDRIGVIADTTAFTPSGYQTTSALLGMLGNLKDEKDPFVWEQIRSSLSLIESAFKFEQGSVTSSLRKFTRQLIGPQAGALGWDFKDTDDMAIAKHKAEMFKAAGTAGDTSITEAASKMFASFIDGDTTTIHPNIRNAVYTIALQNQGRDAYQSLLSYFRTTKNTDEQAAALTALGNTRDPKCIQEMLDLLLTDEVKAQDFYPPILALRKQPIGAEILWKWTRTRWEDIEAKFSDTLGIFGVIMSILIRGLVSERYLSEIRDFFATKDTSKYDKKLATTLDSMEADVAWAKRDREDMKSWLHDNGFCEG